MHEQESSKECEAVIFSSSSSSSRQRLRSASPVTAAPDPLSSGCSHSSLHDDDDSEDDDCSPRPSGGSSYQRRNGRRKIKIEFIEERSRRHITFSKRKAGIMKKAYELSTLTGTQILLLIISETGLVYTFTTQKLKPLVTRQEGKNLIQSCLNGPEEPQP